MLVQLTDYGVSVLQETKKPLNIKTFSLGSSVNYTPSKTAVGLQGEQVYTNSPTQPIAVSANVVKYICALSYEVGNFVFGEAAFFDENNKCVAIGVADVYIEKHKYVDNRVGNSIVLDLYLSMVGGNYDMWIDDFRSDNEFNLPICGSPDALPPVSQSSSNFYIITNAGRGQSSTLAYASHTGLWDFDAYQYKNSHEFTITGCTAGAVTIDGTNLTDEDVQMLQPDYGGQLILEFTSGPNTSICRTIASFRVVNKVGTFSLYTPMATVANAGDFIRVYSRQVFTISDVNIPVATREALGGIIVGDGLSVTVEGNLSVDFPVTSVNGQTGDVFLSAKDINDIADVAISNDYNDLFNKPIPYTLPIASYDTLGGVKIPQGGEIGIDSDGNIDLKFVPVKTVNNLAPDPRTGNVRIKLEDNITGLIFPKRIYPRSSLNDFAASGLYYISADDANTLENRPDYTFTDAVALEVIPIDGEGFVNGKCIQRLCSTGFITIRQCLGEVWTEWSDFLTTEKMPIATTTKVGIVSVGKGLSITKQGSLSANVTSVFGRTGDVTMTFEDWKANLSILIDTFGGIPSLSDNDPNGNEMDYGRISWRRMAYGACYYAGEWNPVSNSINGSAYMQLLENGRIKYKIDTIGTQNPPNASYTRTWTPNGWLVRATQQNKELNLDGINRVDPGDILMSMNGKWRQISRNRNYVAAPKDPGFVYINSKMSVYGRKFKAADSSITINTNSDTISADGSIADMTIKVNIISGGTF